MDALTELEDEFEVEANRRMIYCDTERGGVLVMAHIYVAMPDGSELKLCRHHATTQPCTAPDSTNSAHSCTNYRHRSTRWKAID